MLILLISYIHYILLVATLVGIGVYLARKGKIIVYTSKTDIYSHLLVPVIIVLVMLVAQLVLNRFHVAKETVWSVRNYMLIGWLAISYTISLVVNKSLWKGTVAWTTKTLLTALAFISAIGILMFSQKDSRGERNLVYAAGCLAALGGIIALMHSITNENYEESTELEVKKLAA